MKRIKKGDEVVVITGKSKGKRGVVLKVLDKGMKYIVEGINAAKRHTKPNPHKQEKGGVVIKLQPIHASNVMLYDPSAGKGSRIGLRKLEDGRLARYFKSSGELVEI